MHCPIWLRRHTKPRHRIRVMTSADRIVHCHVLVRQRSHDEKVETSTLPLGTYLRILRMLLTSSHSPISSHIQKHVPVTLSVTVIKQKMMRRRVLVLCLLLSICEDHTTLAGFFRQNRQGREKSLGRNDLNLNSHYSEQRQKGRNNANKSVS